MSFKIVGQATVTEGMLTTDVTEAVAAWSGGATYAELAQASKGQRLWESQQGGNTGHDPESDDGTWWRDIGPTNAWAMFDDQNDTQSTRAEAITVSIETAERFDTLALFNVDAASVTVTVFDGATERHNETYSMVDYAGITDYWEHFFNPVRRKRTLLVEGLPIAPIGMTLGVIASAEGGTAGVGNLVFGQAQVVGGTQFAPELGFLNFSKFEADEFGRRLIVPRTWKKQGSFNVWVDKPYVDRVYDTVVSYTATPALIIGSEDYSAMVYFGLIVSAGVTVSYPTQSVLRVKIEDF